MCPFQRCSWLLSNACLITHSDKVVNRSFPLKTHFEDTVGLTVHAPKTSLGCPSAMPLMPECTSECAWLQRGSYQELEMIGRDDYFVWGEGVATQ